jgi:YVTN family beta-propeller protein
VTNKIYVGNTGPGYNPNNGSITVIDGATNTPTTLTAATSPSQLAVNPVTNKIYVANSLNNNVVVIDGATNAATPVPTGTSPYGLTVNPITNTIYVANAKSNNITIIDGATNSTSTLVGGTYPWVLAVNDVTNKVYVANSSSNNVTAIDGATNSTATVNAGSTPWHLAVNPVSNKIYVANFNSNNVTAIDGATNSAATISAATNPRAVAVNAMTDKIYVANYGSANVTVIDGVTNSTTTVTAGNNPYAVAVNPVTNKVYVANYGSGSVTVIDGATNSTTTVNVGSEPYALAVNPVTNKIYVANYHSANVSVIDGATNSATTVSVGSSPGAVSVNPVTNKIYVANVSGNSVTVIDGVTNSTTTISVGLSPRAVDVNAVINKIYVANYSGVSVTVIDGVTNSTTTVSTGIQPYALAVDPVTNKIYVANMNGTSVTVIDGVTNSTTTVTAGNNPHAVAVNPVTNKVYVANYGSNNVTVITEQEVQPIPLVTAIAPLTNNQTQLRTPIFNFTASTSFGPYAPSPQMVFYQLDTWQLPWQAASGVPPNFTGATPTLSLGTHILYAFATDGQDANSTGVAQQLIGSMAAYLFDVVQASTTTVLNSDSNPSNLGEQVTFTASVTVNSPGTGTPTGSVTFYDGSTTLGTVALDSSQHAAYATSSLTVGSHSITANYLGDTNFLGSTSTVLTQVVQASTTTALASNPNPSNVGQSVTFTATVTVTPPGTGTPTGTVSFYDGSTLLGSVTLPSNGQASYATWALTAGSHSITATYSGDSIYLTSTSPVLTQVVNALPVVTLSPTSLKFGNQAVNTTSAVKKVTLTNTGTVLLTISNIAASAYFAISANTCPGTLAAGAKCTVSVTFSPTVLGALTGSLTFTDNAADSPQTVALSGTGVAQATLTPATITFASQAILTTSAAKTFTLTNNLPMALSITSITFTGTNPGDFAQTNTCGSSVASKKKCTISVTFTPQATGSRTATLNIKDSANNSPQTVSLTGTGEDQVTWTPSSLTFASRTVGTTSPPKNVTLTNNLPTALSMTSITFTGTDMGDFAQTNTCGSSVASKGKCTISVTFTPKATGTRTATLNIKDSANNSPQTVNLTGTGK